MLMQNSATINALTQTDDVLVNQIWASNYRTRYRVIYALVASATGLLLDLQVGARAISSQFIPSLQNRIPIYPDDYLGAFVVMPGDRILLRARETSNNNRTLYYAFRFTPI